MPPPSTLPNDTPAAAWFNDAATPPLELTPVARALFRQMTGNAAFISAQTAVSPQATIEALKGARVWQFWTHGRFDQGKIGRSGVQLARRD